MAFRWTGARPMRHAAAMLHLAFAAFLPAPALASAVEAVRVEEGRIVIRFDGAVERAAALVLDGPRRIAVDVTGAQPGRGAAVGGVVTAVRQAARPAGARLVFDLAEPALVSAGRFAADGRELRLDLAAAAPGAFARASRSGPLSFLWGERRPAYRVTRAVPPPRRLKLPDVEGPDGRPLVVIDAGHGGADPGALGPAGEREKDLTLKVARAIRDELVRSGRVRVGLTRDDDRFLTLRERYGVARRMKADLFISVHCDAAHPDATGASAYTLSEVASDKEAARLAARENKADVIAGVDLRDTAGEVRNILIDLAQRETMNVSAGFARLLGREAKPLIPVKPVFHRMASLMVLKAPDMPSVLFETGYISNPEDAKFLGSADGRGRVAESVRRAVEVHFARRMASR